MKNLVTRSMTIAAFLAAATAMNVGCSSDSGTATDGGTGGKATGGAGGAGGAGAGGKAGGTGTDAGQVVHQLNYTFDSSIQGWALNAYADPNQRNLAGVYPSDGGVDAEVFDGGTVAPPTLTFDSSVGEPALGSLKVSAIFTDCNQYVDATITLSPTKNLTGATLHGRLQVTSGLFSGGAQLHVQTGITYDAYASAPFVVVPVGFGTASLELATAIPADPTHPLDPTTVIQVGVQIFSGSACTATTPYPNAGVPVVFNIDTVTD